ncbi:MAG: ATP-binding protein [Planctomycetota bacterium]
MSPRSMPFDAEALLDGLGWVGFERESDGRFRPIAAGDHLLFRRFPTARESDDLALVFPFLDAFLPEAEERWASEAKRDEPELLISSPWSQRDEAGELVELRAYAGRFGEGAVLFLEVDPQRDEDERRVLQLARDHRLAQEKLDRARRALEESEQRYRELAEDLERRVDERTEQLRSLTYRLVDAEQAERRRIAVGLHDRLGQSLAVVRLGLGGLIAQGVIPQESEGALSESLDAAIRYTRNLTYELGSPVLYELGLEPALEELGRRFEERTEIAVEVACDSTKELAIERAVLVYEAVRELLHNCEKHSGAEQIWVETRWGGGDDNFSITVRDDGCGFDPDTKRAESGGDPGGFGLFSLEERVNHVGGTCRIESRLGDGTRVELQLGPEPGRGPGTGEDAS